VPGAVWDARPRMRLALGAAVGAGRPRPRGVATSRAGVPTIGTRPFVLGPMGVLPASMPLSFQGPRRCCPGRGSPGLPRCPPACVHAPFSALAEWQVAIGMRILMHVFFWEALLLADVVSMGTRRYFELRGLPFR
jgi:hypothetical protein